MARFVTSQSECEHKPKRRMETTTENSEASAETTDADNTNAILSVNELAQSFVEKVEAESEETPSTEATEESTETEVVDAAEEAEGEVLLQPHQTWT